MIVVEAATRSGNSYEFTIPESLQEITLGRFVAYQNEVDLHMPESMRAYYDADKEKREELLKQIPLSDITVLWFDFYIKAVKYWCRLSDDQVAELSHDEVLYIYNIINNHLFSFEHNEELRSFTFKGQEYLYPAAPINTISNTTDYFKGARVIELIESMQFEMYSKQLGASKWSSLTYIIAILCKKKGEQLPIEHAEREQWIAERAKLFEQLPVNEALNVAFFLRRLKIISLADSSLYSTLRGQDRHQMLTLRFGKSTDGKPASKGLLSLAYSKLTALTRSKAQSSVNAINA